MTVVEVFTGKEAKRDILTLRRLSLIERDPLS